MSDRQTPYIATGTTGLLILITSITLWIRKGGAVFELSTLIGLTLSLESIIGHLSIGEHTRTTTTHLTYLIKLILLGAVIGFFFDLLATQVYNMWTYNPVYSPHSNPTNYILTLIPSWGLYFLSFHQSYRLLHHLLHKDTKAANSQPNHFAYIGITGIGMLVIGTSFPTLNNEPYLSALIAVTGTWFILEGLEIPRRQQTLLSDIMHGNIRPLLAILISALAFGFVIEYINVIAATQHWHFKNLPWLNTTVAGIPIVVLLSWAWMYIIYLTVENMLFHHDKNLWQ